MVFAFLSFELEGDLVATMAATIIATNPKQGRLETQISGGKGNWENHSPNTSTSRFWKRRTW